VAAVEDVARYLRVNRKTVYEAVEKTTIPAQRVGRSIRFPREPLLEWLKGEDRVSRSLGS
jgi:excisionase family DNA binding protein